MIVKSKIKEKKTRKGSGCVVFKESTWKKRLKMIVNEFENEREKNGIVKSHDKNERVEEGGSLNAWSLGSCGSIVLSYLLSAHLNECHNIE